MDLTKIFLNTQRTINKTSFSKSKLTTKILDFPNKPSACNFSQLKGMVGVLAQKETILKKWR